MTNFKKRKRKKGKWDITLPYFINKNKFYWKSKRRKSCVSRV